MKKYGKKWNSYNVGRVAKRVYVTKGNVIADCWNGEYPYMELDGFKVYQKWADGEGLVARHLCGNAKCVNPLHLVRGSEIDNAQDEIDVEDFIVEYYQQLLNDDSLEELDKRLRYKVIIPRVSRVFGNELGIKSLKDTIYYGREVYRKSFVNWVSEEIKVMTNSEVQRRLDNARVLFESLRQRNDVEIVVNAVNVGGFI